MQVVHAVLIVTFTIHTIPEFKILVIPFGSAAYLAFVHRMILRELDDIALPAFKILSAPLQVNENILAEKQQEVQNGHYSGHLTGSFSVSME